MSMRHSVIIIPGIDDRTRGTQFLTRHWRLSGLEPIVHAIGWHHGAFEDKLEKLLALVDACAVRGTVSIVGLSAGASAALNMYTKRRERIHRVISICGLIRVLDPNDRKDVPSDVLLSSVDLLANNLKDLSDSDRANILTITPRFGDERVKHENSVLEGAANIQIPSRGHALSIGLALTIFSKQLLEFLTQEST